MRNEKGLTRDFFLSLKPGREKNKKMYCGYFWIFLKQAPKITLKLPLMEFYEKFFKVNRRSAI